MNTPQPLPPGDKPRLDALSKGTIRAGSIFGRLTVKRQAATLNRRKMWECLCVCGNVRTVNATDLRRGHTISCGCFRNETTSNRCSTHGHSKNNTITPEYNAWSAMKSRCYDANDSSFSDYGGRGITVCGRWLHSFENFMADMGMRPNSKHSIDRYPNNNGNYERGNCRWATAKEQSLNKRSAILMTFKGRTQNASLWAEEIGLKRSVIYDRKRQGWSDEKTLTTPIKK